jgi:hypothetical protein
MTPSYKVGQVFKDRKGRVNRVVDIWTTRNIAGEIVKIRYVCEHEFCGQTVTDRDVTATTISRCLAREG